MRERKARIATGLVSGSGLGMREGALCGFYGEAVGRCHEIDDYIDMKFEDLLGG